MSSSPVRVINRFVEKFKLEDVVPVDHRASYAPGLQNASPCMRRAFEVAFVSSSRCIRMQLAFRSILICIPVGLILIPGVGADHLALHKPHPEPWLLGAKRVGCEPSHCLVFEDSSAGLIAARAASMHSVGILHVCGTPRRIYANYNSTPASACESTDCLAQRNLKSFALSPTLPLRTTTRCPQAFGLRWPAAASRSFRNFETREPEPQYILALTCYVIPSGGVCINNPRCLSMRDSPTSYCAARATFVR